MEPNFDFQHLLEALIEEGEEFKIRAYSGRGMYGKECLAVVADDPLLALQVISLEAGKRGIEMPRHISQDSMGLQTVLYWPGTPFEGSSEGE